MALTIRSAPASSKTPKVSPPAQSVDVVAKGRGPEKGVLSISYKSSRGVDGFVKEVRAATPYQIVETERHGVAGPFVKDLSKRLNIPASQMFRILGLPKATAEKKAASGESITGSAGQAAIGVVKLLGLAQDIVADSNAEEAKGFDAGRWLGTWLERPQPALGGRRPSELLDTPTGLEVVTRLLGSLRSGAYQ
jgi:putative toxin-antitoxin system antitoxin component (TIGR02293 family)